MLTFLKYIILFIYAISAVFILLNGFTIFQSTVDKIEYFDRLAIDLSPQFGKVVFILIDGLAYRFMENKTKTLPFMFELENNNIGVLFNTLYYPPTYTYAGIKSFMTGTLPSIDDLLRNTGIIDMEMPQNILSMYKKLFSKFVLFGNQDWIKYFPNLFKYTQFSDYYDVKNYKMVDDAMMEDIFNTSKTDEWQVMCIHFCGLDHIGHGYGGNVEMIDEKLKEMDQFFKQLWNIIHSNTESDKPPLFVVFGDHGMSKTGSHGANSLYEIEAATYIFSKAFSTRGSLKHHLPLRVKSVDLTSFMSMMGTGQIQPFNSFGLIPEIFEKISKPVDWFKYVGLNCMIIFQHFQRFFSKKDMFITNVREDLKSWKSEMKLISKNPNKTIDKKLVQRIYHRSKTMQEFLLETFIGYSYFYMIFSVVVILMIMYIIVCDFSDFMSDNIIDVSSELSSLKDKFSLKFYLFMVMQLCGILYANIKFCLILISIFPLILMLKFSNWIKLDFILYHNSVKSIIISFIWKIDIYTTFSFLTLSVILIFHGIKMFGSSLIEQESLYIFYTLQIIILLFYLYRIKLKLPLPLYYVSTFILVRLIRDWNPACDRCHDMLNFHNYLFINNYPHIMYWMINLGLFGVYIFVYFMSLRIKEKKKFLQTIVSMFILILFIFYNQNTKLFMYNNSQDDFNVQNVEKIIFCCTIVLMIILKKYHEISIFMLMLIFSDLHNIPVYIALIIVLKTTQAYLYLEKPDKLCIIQITMMYQLMAYHAFYSMGNAANMISLNFASGHVAFTEMLPNFMKYFVILFNTFVFTGFAIFLLPFREKTSSVIIMLLFETFALMCLSLSVIIQKFHLFIWSVFIPRLIFQTLTLIGYLLYLTVYFVVYQIKLSK